eukprot:TRINITY_DN23755_c0_g1_i1.p1 TRINITY_DN23755_c0_g1~~TRINITY_DN23755_c0_g1_i1.p1  ORF type:complete len:656 (-),score=113.63 TRINITY_DN23755_c0_g1_i1:135-2102(-)
MEATVRLLEGEPTIKVQLLWRNAEINLLRERGEPLERFLTRLGLSCAKHAPGSAGSDRKRAKKERKKLQPSGLDGSTTVIQPTSSGLAVSLLDKDGKSLPGTTTVEEALKLAGHMEIDGDRLPVMVNPPSIRKLEVYGKPLVGCPLVASLRCEFCNSEAFRLLWQVEPAETSRKLVMGDEIHGEGRVFFIPLDAKGRQVTLRIVAKTASGEPHKGFGRLVASAQVGIAEEIPEDWPERRSLNFTAASHASREGNDGHVFRIVCFNILAAPYARSTSATRDMYPYCPASALDFQYRQPLLGRELHRLDGDIVCLQECQYSTYSKFLLPVFGDGYHIRMSLKASQVSEGCVTLLRKSAFEVLEERDFHFRKLFRRGDAFIRLLREVKAKWPNFIDGILPHLSTVFQVIAMRHVASGEVLVLSNTHLFFHPQAKHVRLLQVICLLQEVQEMRKRHATIGADGNVTKLPRVIFCGDLNCLPKAAALQLLQKGDVGPDHLDWDDALQFVWGRDGDDDADDDAAASEVEVESEAALAPAESAAVCGAGAGEDGEEPVEPLPTNERQPGNGLSLRTPLGVMLANVYEDALSSLPFTNYVKDFHGVLDYIFTSANDFRVLRTLPGVTEQELQSHGGLPSILHPSDHLSIAADVELASPTSVRT